MAPPKGTKKRKANFVAAEMDILIAALQQHKELLYGAQRANTTVAQRRAIFEAIALDINALGNEDRSWDDIQKKLNDMRRRVRDKLALIRKHTGGTGGGPRCKIRLNHEEELIAQTFVQEQVEGLAGYDSTVGNLGTGGDEDDEAGPSSAAGRPTPSIPEPGVQSGPMDIMAMLVQEEILPGPSMVEEVVLEEDSFFLIQEDSGSLQEDTTIPEQPTTPPPSTSSPSRASPSRASPSIVDPSPSPSVRARASPPRKALSKTRHISSSLRDGLLEEQALQTRHIGAMVGDVRRLADSMASTSTSVQHALTLHADRDKHVSQSLAEISGNSKAIVTCLVAQENAPALLSRMAAAVEANTAAVQANTAAVREEGRVTRRHQRNTTTRQMRMLAQTNTILARLANAMEGMQPPPARSLEVGVDAPPPLHPHPMPPPHHGD